MAKCMGNKAINYTEYLHIRKRKGLVGEKAVPKGLVFLRKIIKAPPLPTQI